MKINKLGFLFLPALLGILGLILEFRPLLGFFGFAYYFRYFFVKPDEMFMQYVRRAASIGFFSGFSATCVAVVMRILWPTFITANTTLASCYVVSVFSFTIVLMAFEVKEKQGC